MQILLIQERVLKEQGNAILEESVQANDISGLIDNIDHDATHAEVFIGLAENVAENIAVIVKQKIYTLELLKYFNILVFPDFDFLLSYSISVLGMVIPV